MFEVSLKLVGIEEVIKSFGRRAEVLVEMVDYVTKVNAEEIKKNAKNRAPRLTGALRRSIIKYQIAPMVWAVGSDVPYAKVRNYINRKNPQTVGYLTNSLFEQRDKYHRDVGTVIKRLKEL